MKNQPTFRLKYQSRRNPIRLENTDTYYSLTGIKSCIGRSHCNYIQLPSGKKHLLCNCPIETDKVRIRCPICEHVGYLFLQGGVSDRNRIQKHAYDIFHVHGDLNTLSIDKTLTCTACLSQYTVRKGVMTKTGTYELPFLSDDEFHKLMREHHGFVDLNQFIESYQKMKAAGELE